MSLQCGIVGLPNIGKSTIFNAMTNTLNAQAANYPFCTIEPNISSIPILDARLNALANITEANNIIPSTLDVVDIAGLVRGANKGDGLGNQFLAHIRNVDAIMHVVRCFSDDDIIHVENDIDAVRDISIIEMELLLSDMALLEKRLIKLQKNINGLDSNESKEVLVIKKLLNVIEDGKLASSVSFESSEEIDICNNLALLTNKPIIYVANLSEADLGKKNIHLENITNIAKKNNVPLVSFYSKLELEMSGLSDKDKNEMMRSFNLKETGLHQVIHYCHKLLDLCTFFTAGKKEVRGWPIKRGTMAAQAAGTIHSDFERGFIKVDTISYDDFIAYNGENGAKQNGKMRSEGKSYVVQDGDVLHFKFNV